MFYLDVKEFLNNVCQEIKYKPIRKGIADELENHIQEIKEEYIEKGMNEDEAEEKAVKQMGEAKTIGKELNKVHKPKLDWKLLLITVILICFGILVDIIRANNLFKNSITGEIIRYVIFLGVGIIPSGIIYFTDYKRLQKYSNIIYIIATLSIFFAMLFGKEIGGKPYLYFNLWTVAPEVIAMPLYIIAFVGFVNDFERKSKLKSIILKFTNKEININFNLVKIILLSIFSVILLTLIPSIASTFILLLTYLIISTIKIIQQDKNKVKHLIILWGMVIIGGILFTLIFIRASGTYRLNKINMLFNPESDSQGEGWTGVNRKIIIQNAKMFGESENKSQAISLFDDGTDYAFISIIAHYGWFVGILIVFAIILFSFRLIFNAIKIREIYGKFIIIGLASMFILQSIFNILMNLNLWIESGFNLPFVSYGIGNLIMNLISLSIILSVYRRKDINVYEEEDEKKCEKYIKSYDNYQQ